MGCGFEGAFIFSSRLDVTCGLEWPLVVASGPSTFSGLEGAVIVAGGGLLEGAVIAVSVLLASRLEGPLVLVLQAGAAPGCFCHGTTPYPSSVDDRWTNSGNGRKGRGLW